MNSPVMSLALALVLGAAVPVNALAGEEPVRIDMAGTTIVGTLTLPEGVERPPIVLMLHGFTGQKNEFPIAGTKTGLFTHTAARLADEGIASLRIDFRGSGESGGRWEDTTFSRQIDDAVRAFDHIQTEARVDGSRVGLLGYSQGGLVASHLAARRPEASAVTLWAPVADPAATFSGLLGRDTVERAARAPDAELFISPLSWGGTTTLAAPYFKELFLTDPVAAAARYPGPLQVIVGAKETIVTPQPASGQIFLDYHEGSEKLVVIDSDHDWNALSSGTTVDADLLPATIEWFKSHL